MKHLLKLISYLTYPFVLLYRWSEHRYNTIESNEKCDAYIRKLDNINDFTNKYDDFAKAKKVIETMTLETHSAVLRYIILFRKKWNDRYLKDLLMADYNIKLDRLLKED